MKINFASTSQSFAVPFGLLIRKKNKIIHGWEQMCRWLGGGGGVALRATAPFPFPPLTQSPPRLKTP